MKTLKKIIWLIKNQDKIEKLLSKPVEKPKKSKGYSTAGVPEYQIEYVNQILNDD